MDGLDGFLKMRLKVKIGKASVRLTIDISLSASIHGADTYQDIYQDDSID